MELTVVIVSYNTSKIIHESINSVLKQEAIDYELIVIDNNSPDESAEVLQQYGDKIKLILNRDNIGAGAAVNQGYSQGKGRFFYLLNPDAVLQTTKDLRHLVDYMEANKNVGLAGTRVLENDGQTEVLPRYTYPSHKHVKTKFDHLPGKIAWMLGASTTMRREVFEKTGGYAKEFFLYGDEVDMCLRIRKLGYEIGYVENVTVMHAGGGSEHNTKAYDYWIKKQNGYHAFIKKHYVKDDVMRLLKKDIFRSGYRACLLKARQSLFGLSAKNIEKLDRYRAIGDSSKMLMDKL